MVIRNRCGWVNPANPLYIRYHDTEWGVPERDDGYLFEMLLLESFQAGLSWECILNKREAFRKAFDRFDYRKIAEYDDDKLAELAADPGIIRNRKKIAAARTNAGVFLSIQKEFGSFSDYLWSFTGGKILCCGSRPVPVSSPLSEKISGDLKRRGMKFVGSVIIYSYLQAVGILHDHTPDCDLHIDREKVSGNSTYLFPDEQQKLP